jgi:2-alkenal reductase
LQAEVAPPPRPSRPNAGWFVAIVAAAFIGGAASGAVVSLLVSDGSSGSGPPKAAALAGEESAITAAIDAANASVVTIVDESETKVDAQGNPFQSVSVGTGIIFDARGYVVTNEHVIHDPGKLSVVLNGGETRPATVVSTDAPFTDLAVLRIPAGNLQALRFGDSDALKLGQTVIAIGSALFEYRNSVSVGVVSGLGRRYFRNNIFMEDLIQTDAAINNGNSGGPLLNKQGEVVGITTNVVRRIADQDNVYGIAFAISSKTIQPIVKAIVDRGSYPRPYIGIDHVDIDADLQAKIRLPVDRGALVQRVVAGSPAEAAGLRTGDIILKLGRYDLDEDTPFLNALARLNPRDRVAVQIVRDGRPLQATIEVTQR